MSAATATARALRRAALRTHQRIHQKTMITVARLVPTAQAASIVAALPHHATGTSAIAMGVRHLEWLRWMTMLRGGTQRTRMDQPHRAGTMTHMPTATPPIRVRLTDCRLRVAVAQSAMATAMATITVPQAVPGRLNPLRLSCVTQSQFPTTTRVRPEPGKNDVLNGWLNSRR